MILAMTAFFGLATTYWIALPFLSDRWAVGSPSRGASSERLRDLEVQREGLLRELKDLEFDRRMGKVDEAEYSQARSRVTTEASAVLARLDRLRGVERAPQPRPSFSFDRAAVEVEAEIAITRARRALSLAGRGAVGDSVKQAAASNWECTCGRAMDARDAFCASCGQPRSEAAAPIAV